jgi:hypothetical protein
MLAYHRTLLWTGLCGTALLVFGCTFYAVSRVWASSFTQTLEVLVASPFVGLWMLSPLLWATRPGTERLPDGEAGRSARVAGVLLVAVGAVAYLWKFAVEPLYFDVEPGLEALLVVLWVPATQWAVLGGAAAVQWARDRSVGLDRQGG